MESDFSEVLIQVLGLGGITREKFFKIIEMKKSKRLSSQEFLKLLSIIEKQQEAPFENPKRLFWFCEQL